MKYQGDLVCCFKIHNSFSLLISIVSSLLNCHAFYVCQSSAKCFPPILPLLSSRAFASVTISSKTSSFRDDNSV